VNLHQRLMMGYRTAGAASTLLLDVYTGCVAGYSVARQLKSAATASIRVRSSGDGYATGTNIGFAAGVTDNSQLTTLVGANTGVIEHLFDQVGTSHLTQGTNANRPTIISAGVTNTCGTNSKPSIVLDSTDLLSTVADKPNFSSDLSLSGDVAWTAFIVHKKTTNTAGCLFGWGESGTALKAAGYYDDGTFGAVAFAGSNDYKTTVPTNSTHYLTTIIKTAGAINATTTAYRNGVSVASTGHSTNSPNVAINKPLYLGRWADYASNGLQGHVQELLIFAGDKSADRAAIESNINTFYGIY
jgi:hypothetical protein